eukprot:TRINITY_DN8586_c0_g1_i1.p1 TRINITY_DN8586_c0_g1~~TRINITY_DN8586_c0_g1_i1.p1  ORF type:complete len:139 (-),score=13.78 TRINITY_DN8586_c0_g1_i1:133-504(-)
MSFGYYSLGFVVIALISSTSIHAAQEKFLSPRLQPTASEFQEPETSALTLDQFKTEIVKEVLNALHAIYEKRNELDSSVALDKRSYQGQGSTGASWNRKIPDRARREKQVRFHQCYFNPISCF